MKPPTEVWLNDDFGWAVEAGGFTPPEYRHKYVRAEQKKPEIKNMIRPISKKRAAEQRQYSKLRKLFLENNLCYPCYIGRGKSRATQATEVHHIRGKVGRLLCYTPEWLPVCADCHRWITDNPKQARELGLICEAGQWNVFPKCQEKSATGAKINLAESENKTCKDSVAAA